MKRQAVIIEIHDGKAIGVSAEVKDGVLELRIPLLVVAQNEPMEAFTRTEKEVLKWLVDGYSNREIAERMQMKIRTICFHVSNILRQTRMGRKELVNSKEYKRGENNEGEQRAAGSFSGVHRGDGRMRTAGQNGDGSSH